MNKVLLCMGTPDFVGLAAYTVFIYSIINSDKPGNGEGRPPRVSKRLLD